MIFAIPFLLVLLFAYCIQINAYELYTLILIVLNMSNYVFGEYSNEDLKEQLKFMHTSRVSLFIRIITSLALIIALAYATWLVADQSKSANWVYHLFWIWILSGIVNSTFGIALAHDWIHHSSSALRILGRMMLTLFGLPFFTSHHLFSHHAKIGKTHDPSVAEFQESFYSYFKRIAIYRLKEALIPKLYFNQSVQAKVLYYNMLHLSVWLGLIATIYYFIGYKAVIFFLLHSMLLYIFYEVINYVQHYGLIEHQGQITINQSWNSYFKYSCSISFLLPAHSAHHLSAKPWTLDSVYGPKLPYSYFIMIFIALIPPWWFKLMNPRIDALKNIA